jgi:hypothetical protein
MRFSAGCPSLTTCRPQSLHAHERRSTHEESFYMDAGEGRRGLRRRLLLQALLPAEHNNKTLTGNSRANWYIERGHLRRGIRLGTAHTFRNRIRQGPWIVEAHGAVVRWLDFVRVRCNRKRPRCFRNVAFINAGNDLLSHTLSRAVQSALRGLTSVFGMGTGGSPAVRSPTTCSSR